MMIEQKQKVSNYKNFQKLFPPNVCVYCGYIIDEQRDSSTTKCEHCLSKENE